MDAIVTASFLLVGWNTYSAIVVAKDTYTGKMPGPKSLGYSIAGLAGLSAFLLYFYGIKAEENPQLLAAEGSGEISWNGGRIVSIEENVTVNYYWRTRPEDIDVDDWDIESQVEEKVREEMYDEADASGGNSYWHFNDEDGNDVEVDYNWNKFVEDGEEEYIKSWAETDESFGAEDRDEDERMTRAEAEDLVQKVEKLMTPYVERLEVCGSYRRGSQSPGDLDVIIIPKKGMTLPMIVQDINPAQVNWLGEQKTQIVIDGHKVDFRVSSIKGWGAALLYFTGPAGYNIGMRMRAKKLGMKLNEYGIFDRATDKYLGGETEDEIYQVLGKTPKTPEMRSKRAEQTSVQTKANTRKCSHCGVIGETFTVKEKHFCGPVCLHKYEGLAADSENTTKVCVRCNGLGDLCRGCSGLGADYPQEFGSCDLPSFPCPYCDNTGKATVSENMELVRKGFGKMGHYFDRANQELFGPKYLFAMKDNPKEDYEHLWIQLDDAKAAKLFDWIEEKYGIPPEFSQDIWENTSHKYKDEYDFPTEAASKKARKKRMKKEYPELFEATSENPYGWLTEGECAMCNNDAKFVVEDLAVGPRGFCCEACYAIFDGLPVKEEGYYGLASEVFEAPRATYTDAGQQTFEKSYNVKAKKPLNAIVKDKMGGRLPSDDSRKYSWGRDFNISNMSKKESRLVEQYFSGLCMAFARFQTSNQGHSLTSVQSTTANDAYMKSLGEQEWLKAELKDYFAMQTMSDQEIVDYIAGQNGMDFSNMLQLIRYGELMEGPYADIKMVATDRSPFEVNGGYGNVYYSQRNPYSYESLSMKNFGSWDKTDNTFKSKDGRRAGKVFTRITKLRPYTTFPDITDDEDSKIEYSTDGGYRTSPTYFTMSPSVFVDLHGRRNTESYAANIGKGWRYNIKDWEGVKSAPYRYATMVRLPTMEELFRAYANTSPMSLNSLRTIYNKSKNLNRLAEAAKQKKENEEQALRKKKSDLAAKNQAQTDLEEINKSIAVLIKKKVIAARAAGLGDDEIYETLENTLYDIEDMVHDWEPDNYMAEDNQSFGCGKCGIGPLHTTKVEGLSFVLCPDCGLVKGKEDITGWNVTWSKDTPYALANRPFADVEWDDSEE